MILFGGPRDSSDHDWYSNFWVFPRPVFFYGHLFWHTEGIYQWLKNPSDSELLVKCLDPHPSVAKRAGRKTKLRADWDTVRFHCMQEALHCKVLNFPTLLVKLLESGYVEIHENRRDTVWGGGPNYPYSYDMLGQCWVQVRGYFRILMCSGNPEYEHGIIRELQSLYPKPNPSGLFNHMEEV